MIETSELLYLARKLRGLSQEEAAENLGCNSKSIFLWEKGEEPLPRNQRIIEQAAFRWIREALEAQEDVQIEPKQQ